MAATLPHTAITAITAQLTAEEEVEGGLVLVSLPRDSSSGVGAELEAEITVVWCNNESDHLGCTIAVVQSLFGGVACLGHHEKPACILQDYSGHLWHCCRDVYDQVGHMLQA